MDPITFSRVMAANAALKNAQQQVTQLLGYLPGPIPTGTWKPYSGNGIVTLKLNGTGSVTIDAKDFSGNIISGVYTTTLTGAANLPDLAFLGTGISSIKATTTGTAAVEIA